MVLVGQFLNKRFLPFGDVSDDVTRSLDVCHKQACRSIVSKLLRFDRVNNLYFRIQTALVRFHLRRDEIEKCYF